MVPELSVGDDVLVVAGVPPEQIQVVRRLRVGPPVRHFYGQDGMPVGEPYQSLSSHKQVLEQYVCGLQIPEMSILIFL